MTMHLLMQKVWQRGNGSGHLEAKP